MKFLDVHKGTGKLRDDILFLVFQSDHFEALQTVIVVPCVPISRSVNLGKLTPVIYIKEEAYRANIAEIGAIRRKLLVPEPISSCSEWRDDLIGALDLIVTGF